MSSPCSPGTPQATTRRTEICRAHTGASPHTLCRPARHTASPLSHSKRHVPPCTETVRTKRRRAMQAHVSSPVGSTKLPSVGAVSSLRSSGGVALSTITFGTVATSRASGVLCTTRNMHPPRSSAYLPGSSASSLLNPWNKSTLQPTASRPLHAHRNGTTTTHGVSGLERAEHAGRQRTVCTRQTGLSPREGASASTLS